MSKVVILWFNFSTSISSGQISSGMSIYKADLINAEIGHSKCICNCQYIQARSVNVTNRRNTFLTINNIRTHDDKNATNLNIGIFYKLLKDIINKDYVTFNFQGNNIAIHGHFDDLDILKKFKTHLSKYYKFDAPILMKDVAVDAADEKDARDDDPFPFMNNDYETIARFTKWMQTF